MAIGRVAEKRGGATYQAFTYKNAVILSENSERTEVIKKFRMFT